MVAVSCITLFGAVSVASAAPGDATLRATKGPKAGTVVLTGAGFTPATAVTLTLRTSNCSVSAKRTASADGAFRGGFTMAPKCSGRAVITAKSSSEGATANFTLPKRATTGSPATAATTPTARKKIFLGATVEPGQLDEADFAAALKKYEFDSLTAENAMKQQNIHPGADEWKWEGPDKIVEFAQANNMRVRGHTLLWYRDPPGWLNEVGEGAPARAAMKNHIQTIMKRYKGKVQQWDVVNEAFDDDGSFRDEDMWREKVGENYIALAFQYARQADPDAELYYNDYGAESRDLDGNGGTNRAAKSDGVYKMVKQFKANNVPIDGVGLQTHSAGKYPGTKASLTANMNRLGKLGVDTEITELDTKEGGDGQADRYAEIGAACKASPRCTGVTTWGLYDGHSWLPGTPLLLDKEFKPKPAYPALLKSIGRS